MSTPLPVPDVFVPEWLPYASACLSVLLLGGGLFLWSLHEPPFMNTRAAGIAMTGLGVIVFAVSLLAVLVL